MQLLILHPPPTPPPWGPASPPPPSSYADRSGRSRQLRENDRTDRWVHVKFCIVTHMNVHLQFFRMYSTDYILYGFRSLTMHLKALSSEMDPGEIRLIR